MQRNLLTRSLFALAAIAAGAVATRAAIPFYRTDLADGASALITTKFLHGQYHVMQSFAFNNVNGDIYAVQVEGSDSAGTWSQHWANGDLELTRLSADGASVLGYMYLRGFGHGVSMGVEPAGSSVYLWTEVDSQPNSEGSGRGTKLGRFLYSNGTTLDTSSSSITKFSPIAGVTQVTPSIDMTDGYLTERYLTSSNQFRLALFRLADVKAGGTPTALRDIAIPSGLGTFEGYTTFGNFVYLYTGNNYDSSNPPPGNTELYCYDWNTGLELQRAHTDAFGSQIWREPEGMAFRVDSSGQPKLCFGFSSSVSDTDGRRVISIAYKQAQLFDALASGPSVFKTDFDGDGKSDYTVWRPLTGKWYWIKSSTGTSTSTTLGVVGDIPVPGDYDGDGKTDQAVWDPATGTWFVLQSTTGNVVTRQWGQAGDIPIVGDFDGDHKADYAVWRPSNGTWYIVYSSTGATDSTHVYGIAGDVPTPGDYDHDGLTDFSVWRPSTGTWYVWRTSTQSSSSTTFGVAGDIPIAGDYDGDGKTDLSVWRPSTGKWYIIPSTTGTMISQVYGVAGDFPVAGDYENDGKTDHTVWRPSDGNWYLLKSSGGSTITTSWGVAGDIALP